MYVPIEKSVGKVDSKLHEQYFKGVFYSKRILHRVISVMKFLGKRGFRGSSETFGSNFNGNFLGLLDLISEYDPFLRINLVTYSNPGKCHVSYLSKNICNLFIQLMLQLVENEIFAELKASKYYSISVDSSADISIQCYELALIVRITVEDSLVTTLPTWQSGCLQSTTSQNKTAQSAGTFRAIRSTFFESTRSILQSETIIINADTKLLLKTVNNTMNTDSILRYLSFSSCHNPCEKPETRSEAEDLCAIFAKVENRILTRFWTEIVQLFYKVSKGLQNITTNFNGVVLIVKWKGSETDLTCKNLKENNDLYMKSIKINICLFAIGKLVVKLSRRISTYSNYFQLSNGVLMYIATYPNIDTSPPPRLFLRVPFINASSERPFSVMRRARNYFRNSASEERLSGMVYFAMNSALLGTISFDKLIDEFAAVKSQT
ncbi:hypothetical protein PR048_022623, partial [Dryococelus australis]